MSKIQLKCSYCGVQFERYSSNVKTTTKHHFCCIDCKRNFFKGIKETRTCKQCGKNFDIYKSVIEKTNANGNFCCKNCYSEYQKTLKGNKNNHYTKIDCKCDYCNKDIKVIPSKKQIYKFSFCNIECRSKFMSEYFSGENNPLWKGGSSKYRGNFDEVKKKYFNGVCFCAVCGTTNNIHIHHIIPYRLTQDNSLSNLIPLCNRHHKIIESVSVKFIELFEDERYETAKKYLNLLLRERQFETYCRIIDKQEKMNEIEC